MARILQQPNTSTARVLSSNTKATTEDPGFLQSVVGGIAKPFARLATNVEGAYQQAKSIGDIGNQTAFDADQAKIKDLSTNGQNLPIVGNVKPVGQTGNAVQKLGDALGTGAQVAATVLPIGEGASIGKATLGSVLKQGARVGGATGALYNAGQELQNPDADINSIGSQTLLGGVTGAVGGAVLGPALLALTKTPVGILGVKALMDGGDKWDAFISKYPTAAKQINAVANPGTTLKQGVGAETTALERVTPNYESATPTQKAKLQAQTVNGEPRINEGGLISGRTVNPTSLEKEAAAELETVPGYSDKLTHLETENLVRPEIAARGEQLQSDLDKENIIIPKKQVVSIVRDAVNAVPDESLLLQKSDPAIANYMRVAKNATNANDGTLGGVFRVRKALDAAYQNARGRLAYPGGEGKLAALDEVHTAARDALTQYVIDNAKNTAVKAAMRSQWNLYRALDVISPKAAKESGSTVGRVTDFVKNHPLVTGAGLVAGGVGLGKVF